MENVRRIAHESPLRLIGAHVARVAMASLSFELAFVLFFFAGVYKGDPRLASVPVDLTALFFVTSVGVGGLTLARHKFMLSKRAVWICGSLALFIAWTVVSLAWSPSGIYGPEKAMAVA